MKRLNITNGENPREVVDVYLSLDTSANRISVLARTAGKTGYEILANIEVDKSDDIRVRVTPGMEYE